MLKDRIIYLINAELDGELARGEREELDAALSESEEARIMQRELRRVANLVEGLPEREPPVGLTNRIVSRVTLPEVSRISRVSRWFRPFQPAPVSLAFAAGLLLTVTYYELSGRGRPAIDLSSMVGSMVSHPEGRSASLLDSILVESPGLSGRVDLSEQGSLYVLGFQFDGDRATEIDIALADSGLDFVGIAEADAGRGSDNESYEVSGGTLRVVNQGRKSFSVFLLQTAGATGGGRNISIGISSNGERLFEGVLRG
jgi:anti-sigma factor RsiW